MKPRDAVAAYVARIRNPAKRAYAEAWLNLRDAGPVVPEPERPAGLSYMAAQAVRMEIARLSAERGSPC